jgi:hypothetical protein
LEVLFPVTLARPAFVGSWPFSAIPACVKPSAGAEGIEVRVLARVRQGRAGVPDDPVELKFGDFDPFAKSGSWVISIVILAFSLLNSAFRCTRQIKPAVNFADYLRNISLYIDI